MPTVLTVHTTGMAILVGASYVLDLRLLGLNKNVPLSSYSWVFSTVAVGLVMNLLTGIALFTKNATVWGSALPFLVKMGLVIASAATLLPIRKHVLNSAPGDRDAERRARLLAIVSIVAWSGAITAGRLLAYLVPV